MQPKLQRLTSVVLLAAAATMAVAPMAEAGHGRGNGNGRKYRRADCPVVVREYRPAPRRVVVHHRDSQAVPLLAGFIGGLIVGTHVGTAHAEPVRVVHVYEDPYCHTRYSSIAAYESHMYRCRHPRVVRVIERDSGHRVATQCWHEQRWVGVDDCRYHDDDHYSSREDDRYDDGYDRGDDDRYGDDWED